MPPAAQAQARAQAAKRTADAKKAAAAKQATAVKAAQAKAAQAKAAQAKAAQAKAAQNKAAYLKAIQGIGKAGQNKAAQAKATQAQAKAAAAKRMADAKKAATAKLAAAQASTNSMQTAISKAYKSFTDNVSLKMKEVNSATTFISGSQATMRSLVNQASSTVSNLNGKVTQASSNIMQSNSALNTLKGYISAVAVNVSNSTKSLQEARNAAALAAQAKMNALNQSREATSLKIKTAQELETAQKTNIQIDKALKRAKHLEEQQSKALQAAAINGGGTSVAAAVAMQPLKQTFSNIGQQSKNTNDENFTNINEGIEGYEGLDGINGLGTFTSDELRRYAIAQTYVDRQNMSRARMLQTSELVAQRDSVANNIIMDYMYANEKGTTVNTVMSRINQLNNDKKRKLEINTYYNKSREKYINILKVIILACIIIVPLVIANKNAMISNSIFMFTTVTVIFLTIIFIFYNFSDIYMRDDIDFDKIRIPYDRKAAQLERDGTIIRKKNPLTSFTLTCIGQDCCDGSMVYDHAKNKCLATENFGGIFEKFNNITNQETTVYPNNSEGFVNKSNFKNILYTGSLNCSSTDNYYTGACSEFRLQE